MLPLEAIDDWLRSGVLISSGGDKLLIGWGERTCAPLPDPSTAAPQFFFPDYFLEEASPWFTFSHHAEISVAALLQALHTFKPAAAAAPSWTTPAPELFNQAFNDLKQLFSKGTLKKAVPYAFQTTPVRMSAEQLAVSLQKVLLYVAGRPAYAYGLWDASQGILGATPEYLFRYREGEALETMACAGTAQPGRSLEEFMDDPKERHEHRLVIDDIVRSLSGFGALSLGNTSPVPFGRLHHMVTPIRVALEGAFDFNAIVCTLHPTAALGAFPKEEGSVWLRQFDRLTGRGRFGAPAGYSSRKGRTAACYVAIRNVQWNNDGMRIGAGCGVVPDSRSAYEWKEILGKLQAIREVLSL